MLIENLKFKVLFLHFLMNFDQFFFDLTLILGGLYSRLKCDLSHFGGIIFEGVILEGGVILEALQYVSHMNDFSIKIWVLHRFLVSVASRTIDTFDKRHTWQKR